MLYCFKLKKKYSLSSIIIVDFWPPLSSKVPLLLEQKKPPLKSSSIEKNAENTLSQFQTIFFLVKFATFYCGQPSPALYYLSSSIIQFRISQLQIDDLFLFFYKIEMKIF